MICAIQVEYFHYNIAIFGNDLYFLRANNINKMVYHTCTLQNKDRVKHKRHTSKAKMNVL